MHSNESDAELKASLTKLCAREIPKYQNEKYYNTVPRELFNTLAEFGLTSLTIPESYGGLAARSSTLATVMETLAEFDLGPAIFISVHCMVSGLIAKHGNEQTKNELLPKLASGEMLAAFALTEPQAGSDAHNLSSVATPKGDGYVISGEKCYITSAGFAEIYLVFAKTPSDDNKGITAFVVPSNSPGLTFAKPEKKMGCELSPIASMTLDNTPVKSSQIIGELNHGYRAALSGLAGGRINIAACANGLSATAINLANNHLKERKQFGSALINFQGLQFMLADMYCKLAAGRALVEKAAHDIDSGAPLATTRISSSVAKCVATDNAMSITTDAVQLLGGAGYIREYSVERLMREAKMLQIVEGTNQIQRMVIARELAA